MSGALERQGRFVGRSQIGGTADQPRHLLRDDVQHLVVGIASSGALGVGRVLRQLGIFLAVRREKLVPLSPQFRASPARFGSEVLPDLVRNQEALVLRPAVEALGALDLIDAQRLAMSGMVTLLGGRTVR